MIALRGRVATGLGDLGRWMCQYSKEYASAVGVVLEPGSLNIILDRPWVMRRPEVRLEANKVGVGLGFVRCRANGTPCWVVRTDKNNRGDGDHGLDVLEIVAPVHLRTSLSLVDGDRVVIEVVQ